MHNIKCIYLHLGVPFSVTLLLCAANAFPNLGARPRPTSGSSTNQGLGLGLDVGIGRYLDPLSNEDTKWEVRLGRLTDALEASSRRPSEETTALPGLGRGVTSELSDLFSAGNGIASIPLNSKVKLVQLEGGSSAKTDQIQRNVPGVVNLSLNGSKTDPVSKARPRPRPSEGPSLQQTDANKSSSVPSEGGDLQEGLTQTSSSKNSSLESSSSTTKTEVNESKNQGTGLGLPTLEGVSSLINQVKSEDTHISARKGVDLFGKTDSTVAPSTFKSSEIGSPGQHTQKITPRKGAEPPKIFPRKGVDEQFINYNSSEQLSSDATTHTGSNNIHNVTGSIISVSASTSESIDRSRPSPNPMDIVKHINTIKVDRPRPTLQNVSNATEKTIPMVTSVRPNSESSINVASNRPRPTDMEAVTSKNVPIDGTATKSNSTSSTSNMKNSILDGSGIVASYPPLKKRPKPLITIDSNPAVSIPPVTTEHNSSERDYIIPIVVTILTLPMLVVLLLFLYKKGSEFWERRHYRRMDFLIDGMYND